MHSSLHYQFLNEIQALPFVERILLFGSRAKGASDPKADFDIAVDCPSASQNEWDRVLQIVEGADTLLQIDCVRFDLIRSQKFKDAILENHIVLYKKG